MQQSLLANVSAYKPYIFCNQLAYNLCLAAEEAYYDPPGITTGTGMGHESNSVRNLDLDRLGYAYIDSRTDETHDTFCCLARHRITRRLLIIFR
jgi:hypothetical protein